MDRGQLEIKTPDLLSMLHDLGIASGDLLLTHSSYKSLAGAAGPPEAVARTLVDAVRPGGSSFVPTFNYGELPWNIATTRSLAGIITETFRKLPGAVRSDHPTHPLAGIGPAAAEILAGHKAVRPFGPASPVWRLWERNAWVLLIGVDHTTNSTIHVAEELMDVPYIRRVRTTTVLADGREIQITVRRPPCSNGFNVVDAPLRQRGQIRETRFGNARLLLMRSRDLVAVAVDLLRDDPTALLCPPGCEFCDESRRTIGQGALRITNK
jgi:aminoglycoside 3-N-acetyltransferase